LPLPPKKKQAETKLKAGCFKKAACPIDFPIGSTLAQARRPALPALHFHAAGSNSGAVEML
jgi:hypothetical protein